MKPKITERGWAGHFICSSRCIFRRNTLIEGDNDSVVVSTVGGMLSKDELKIEIIGANERYYETMVFGAKQDGPYIEADTTDQRSFDSPWSICAASPKELPKDVDNRANEMHEAVVAEMVKKLYSQEK